jgi:mono/diheme cytochrome c family protein
MRRAPRRSAALRASALLAAGALSMAPVAHMARTGEAAGSTASTVAPAGVMNAQLAWQNWTLNCQGCHQPDGTGSANAAPSLAGNAAKFLWVPGGREYLGRVPGVANSPLADAELAEVMNWMLWRFDREDLPSNFQPFTAAEIRQLRTRPLRLEASQVRNDLLKKAEASGRP